MDPISVEGRGSGLAAAVEGIGFPSTPQATSLHEVACSAQDDVGIDHGQEEIWINHESESRLCDCRPT